MFDPSLESFFFKLQKSISKKSTSIQPRGGIGSPYLVISKNEILGVFRPFIQRSLARPNNAIAFFLFNGQHAIYTDMPVCSLAPVLRLILSLYQDF